MLKETNVGTGGHETLISWSPKVLDVQRSLRLRVGVSQTSTGKYAWDCTAEGEGMTREEVLAESDALVAALKSRYPAPEGKEK